MKTILLGAILFLAGMQAEQMVTPKIEHHKYETTETHDTITRSCPTGYEGHFVDKQEGFDATFSEPNISWGVSGYSGTPVYTICFKKEFMEEVRKNPEMSTYRPTIKAVIDISPSNPQQCFDGYSYGIPCYFKNFPSNVSTTIR